jgi:DNA modification methylase
MDNINKIICGDWIKELKKLPDKVFHCCVTSPPYWGQRLYWWGTDNPCDGKTIHHDWHVDHTLQICKNCGAKAPVFGLEKTPEEHIEKLVEGFREVRRVLRDDGVLFLNYGDKYWGGKGQSSQAWSTEHTVKNHIIKYQEWEKQGPAMANMIYTELVIYSCSLPA